MADKVCPLCDDGQECAICTVPQIGTVCEHRPRPGRRTVERLGERGFPMWFYIPAAIVIALFAFWFSRTNIVRNRRRAHDPVPGGGSRSDPGSSAGLYDAGGGPAGGGGGY